MNGNYYGCWQNKVGEQKYGEYRNYISAEINIKEDNRFKDIRIINSNEEIIIEVYLLIGSEYKKEKEEEIKENITKNFDNEEIKQFS